VALDLFYRRLVEGNTRNRKKNKRKKTSSLKQKGREKSILANITVRLRRVTTSLHREGRNSELVPAQQRRSQHRGVQGQSGVVWARRASCFMYLLAWLAGCLPTWLTRCSRNRYAGQPVTIATSSTIRAVVGLGEKYLVVAGIPRLRWLPAERASVNHPEFRETVKPNFSRKRKKSSGGQLLSEQEEDFSASSFLVQLDR